MKITGEMLLLPVCESPGFIHGELSITGKLYVEKLFIWFVGSGGNITIPIKARSFRNILQGCQVSELPVVLFHGSECILERYDQFALVHNYII